MSQNPFRRGIDIACRQAAGGLVQATCLRLNAMTEFVFETTRKTEHSWAGYAHVPKQSFLLQIGLAKYVSSRYGISSHCKPLIIGF